MQQFLNTYQWLIANLHEITEPPSQRGQNVFLGKKKPELQCAITSNYERPRQMANESSRPNDRFVLEELWVDRRNQKGKFKWIAWKCITRQKKKYNSCSQSEAATQFQIFVFVVCWSWSSYWKTYLREYYFHDWSHLIKKRIK